MHRGTFFGETSSVWCIPWLEGKKNKPAYSLKRPTLYHTTNLDNMQDRPQLQIASADADIGLVERGEVASKEERAKLARPVPPSPVARTGNGGSLHRHPRKSSFVIHSIVNPETFGNELTCHGLRRRHRHHKLPQ